MLVQILIGVLVTIGLSWMGWVSITIINHAKSINKTEVKVSNMEAIHNDITEVKNIVKDMGESLNQRFDTFIRQELDELKKIAAKEN